MKVEGSTEELKDEEGEAVASDALGGRSSLSELRLGWACSDLTASPITLELVDIFFPVDTGSRPAATNLMFAFSRSALSRSTSEASVAH